MGVETDVVLLSGLFFYFAAVAMEIAVLFSAVTTVAMTAVTIAVYGLSFFSSSVAAAVVTVAIFVAETIMAVETASAKQQPVYRSSMCF